MKPLFKPAIGLMNRLKYPQKFLLVGLIMLLPLSVVLSQYLAQVNIAIDFTTKEQLGLQYNDAVMRYLQDVQEYSSLMSAYEFGDEAFRTAISSPIHEKESEIEQDIVAVDSLDEQLGATLALGQRWADIKQAWAKVEGDTTTPADSAAYNDLIKQILSFIVVIGNNSNLILDTNIDTYYVMDALINKIPQYGNQLSEIRRYGELAALKGQLSPADWTRLNILSGLAQSGLDAQQLTFTYITNYNPSLIESVKPTFDEMMKQASAFLAQIKNDLLSAPSGQATPLHIDPGAYLQNATQTVDMTFSVYALLISTERTLLTERINTQSAQRDTVLAVSLIALALVIYLFGAFYWAVRDLIYKLTVTSRQMVAGQIHEKLVLDAHDELADVVVVFNNIAHEMMSARDQALSAFHALSESEKRLRAILDSAPIAMLVVSLQNTILYMNPVSISMLGDRWQLFSSYSAVDFGIQPGQQLKFQEQLDRQGYIKDQEVQFRDKGNVYRTGLMSVQPLQFSGQAALLIAVVDITDLKVAQEAEYEQHLLTKALLDSAIVITSTLQLDEVIRHIFRNIYSVVQHDVANIMIFEGDEGHILGTGYHVQDQVDYKLTEGRIRYKEDYFGNLIVQSRQPVIIGDIQTEPRFSRYGSGALTLHSFIGIPIIFSQEVIGIIALGSQNANYFTETHSNYLKFFALQAGIAIQNAQRYEQAKTIASLEERQRLARELHDSVSQTLFSANVIAEALPRILNNHPQKAVTYLNDLQRITRAAMGEMRSLLLELRPDSLTQTELGILLNQLCDVFAGRTQIAVDRHLAKQVLLPADTQLVFYRVAQEALNNASKYAEATHIEVDLTATDNIIELRIKDNGKGFDQTVVAANHFGLKIMAERAKTIGAELVIWSQPGAGTEIKLTGAMSQGSTA